jgi:hypothetical protein
MSILMADQETKLAGELWLSFRSVLRSYAAAASLHSEEAARVAWTESEITLTGTNASLDLKLDLASGRGSWHLRVAGGEPAHGKFDLLPEGTIDIDAKVKDLDHAAIDFVGLVTKAESQTATNLAGINQGEGR